MESVEVSAKTVDEAIDIALEDLGLKRSQVDIKTVEAQPEFTQAWVNAKQWLKETEKGGEKGNVG